MEESITLKVDELNPALIEGLKKYLKALDSKEIIIRFSVPPKKQLRKESQQETNARILKAIKEVEEETAKMIEFTGEEFEQLSFALSKVRVS